MMFGWSYTEVKFERDTYQCLQDLHLVDERLEVLDPLLLDGLDRELLAIAALFRQIDNAKTSRSNLLTEVVLILDLALKRVLEELLVV